MKEKLIMKYIELAKQLLPLDVPCQEIPLIKGRLPVPTMAPIGNEHYRAGIYLPAINVDESIEILINNIPDDPYMVGVIEDILRSNGLLDKCNVMSPYNYAVFAIFHELGHWHDFQDRYIALGLDGNDYLKDYRNEEDKLGLSTLIAKIRSAEKGSKKQGILLRDYYKKYRENEFEIIADKYAIMKLISL